MKVTAFLLVALLVAGCRQETLWTRDELYFGMSRPDGAAVSEPEFTNFVDEIITPRFPDGFTIVPVMGQYREHSGRIAREPSRIIVIYAPADGQTNQKIDDIRTLYKQRFAQESVLLVTSPAKVKF
jgi:hypothetical protein